MRWLLWGLWCGLVWARPLVSSDLAPLPSQLLQLGLLTSGLLYVSQSPRPAQLPARLPWAAAGASAVTLLVLLRSPQPRAIAASLDLLAGATAVPVLLRTDARQRRQLLRGCIVVGLGIALFAILQFVMIFPRLADGGPSAIAEVVRRRRALGTFVLPNFLAGYLAMLLPALVSWCRPLPLRARLVPTAALAAGAVAFLLAQSLGATLALAAAGMTALMWRRTGRVARVTWGLGALLVVAGLVMARPMLRQFTHSENSFRNRLAYWQVTVGILQEHPIGGVGLGAFREAYAVRRPPGVPRVIHAHNSYLELGAELGMLGLAAWGWLMVEVLWLSARGPAGLCAAVGAFALHNVVDATLYVPQVNILWWVLVGLIAANAPETAMKRGRFLRGHL